MTNNLGGIYATGTLSVAANGTVFTGVGTLWSTQAEQGDWILANGHIAIITGTIADTALVSELPWTGGALAGASYRLIKMSWLRYEPAIMAQKVRILIAELAAEGTFVFVAGAAPDAGDGVDGQWAMKTNAGSPWKLWFKVAGAWIEQDAAPVSATGLFYHNTNTTEATGVGTTYSARFEGGVEIAKKLFVLGAFEVAGTTKAPTPALGDDSTKIATTAFVTAGARMPLPTGRLSFSNVSSYMTAYYAAATVIFFVDTGGGTIPIWSNALSKFVLRPFSGALAYALDSNAGHLFYHASGGLFDLYAYWDSALGVVRLGATRDQGANFSLRANLNAGPDIIGRDGVLVNSTDSYLRINNTGNTAGTDYIQVGTNQATWLGSFACSANGQSRYLANELLLFNAYDPAPYTLFKHFTAAAYTYSSGTPRIVNADATNIIKILIGAPGPIVEVEGMHFGASSFAPAVFNIDIYDEVGTNLSGSGSNVSLGYYGRAMDTSGAFQAYAKYQGKPSIGLRSYAVYETGPGSGTFNWQAYSNQLKNGLLLNVWM